VSARRAAFIDRDGVIDELVGQPPESPLAVEDVVLIPGAAEALKRLRSAGWLLVGVSNQPAAAKGTVSVQQLEAVQSRVLELLANEGASFDGFRICWHHPHGAVPELTGACRCRKPEPGMLLDAAAELDIDLRSSWMIGDTDADVLAGRAAGCHTVLIQNQGSVHKRGADTQPEVVVPTLSSAIDLLMQAGGRDGDR
jgi:histidinol-phosphate phosphatase family protein